MAYSLKTNPFAILGATTRDDRKRIAELAEEKSFIIDHELCSTAKSELTNPRNRLVSEVGWLPGLSPKKADELLTVLVNAPGSLRSKKENVPSLALANLLTSALTIIDEATDTEEWIASIIDIASLIDKVDLNTLLRDINEDRSISGFPEVKNIENVQSVLSDHIQQFKEATKTALDRLPAEKLLEIVTGAVEISTKMGARHAPPLIDEIVDTYELHTHGFLRSEADKLKNAVKAAEASIDSGKRAVRLAVDKVEKLMRHWCRFARPIQISMKSRGLQHDISLETAFTVRGLVLKVVKAEMLDIASDITNLLADVFTDVPEMVEWAEKDAKELNEMTKTRSDLEKIKSVTDLCEKALLEVQANPKSADAIGQRLFEAAKVELMHYQQSNYTEAQILLAKNHLGLTLSRCGVAYGNSTDKWGPSTKLFEQASDLATDPEITSQINKNLETSKENLRLGGIGAVKSAPSLGSINGIGFTLYGSSNHDPETTSHLATYYFTFFFFPVIPISRYRVIQNGNNYRFLSKVPLRPFDKWHLAIALGIIAWIALANM